MQEFFIKLIIGMVVNSFTVEEIIQAIEKLKEDLRKKVIESEPVWDDYALEAFLQNEDQILSFLNMAREMADQKAKESQNTLDNALWLPISAKLGEVIKVLQTTK